MPDISTNTINYNLLNKIPNNHFRIVQKLYCDNMGVEFQENLFMYEDTSRKDSAGCLSVIMHPKPTAEAPVSHDITEHRVGSLYQVIEFLGLGVNVTEEGVFRKAGSFKKQQDLLEKVEKGEDLELETGPYSIHECASVLKTFLSRLSEPLVTNSCYQARCQRDFKEHYSPQAPDRFNPKVRVQTCGIIQKLYETKHIETMMFGKSVIALFSKIEPKMSK